MTASHASSRSQGARAAARRAGRPRQLRERVLREPALPPQCVSRRAAASQGQADASGARPRAVGDVRQDGRLQGQHGTPRVARCGLRSAVATPMLTHSAKAWLHRISDVAPSSENAAAVYQHPIYEQPWDPGVEAQVRLRAACSSSESTASDCTSVRCTQFRPSNRQCTCRRATLRTRAGARTGAWCSAGSLHAAEPRVRLIMQHAASPAAAPWQR